MKESRSRSWTGERRKARQKKAFDPEIKAMARLRVRALLWGEAWAHTAGDGRWVVTARSPYDPEGRTQIWCARRGENGDEPWRVK